MCFTEFIVMMTLSQQLLESQIIMSSGRSFYFP